jgi:hypothetical protein
MGTSKCSNESGRDAVQQIWVREYPVREVLPRLGVAKQSPFIVPTRQQRRLAAIRAFDKTCQACPCLACGSLPQGAVSTKPRPR